VQLGSIQCDEGLTVITLCSEDSIQIVIKTLFLCVIFPKCYLVFIDPVIEKEGWNIKYMENYCECLICSTDFELVNGNDKNQIMKSKSTKSVWVICISS
jgi:hypothetical protein